MAIGISVTIDSIVGVNVGVLVGASVSVGSMEGVRFATRFVGVSGIGLTTTELANDSGSLDVIISVDVTAQPATKSNKAIPITLTISENALLSIRKSFEYQRSIAISTVKGIIVFMKLARADPNSVNGVPAPPNVSH